MRVAIIAESFLPLVNGVTNSVLRVLEHLAENGHDARVIAPGAMGKCPAEACGFPVTRLASVNMPGYAGVQIATTPSYALERILEDFQPDVVHLAAPFNVGYRGALAVSRLELPSVAIYQTEIPSYAARYGVPHAEALLWWRVRQAHNLATMTLAPSSFARNQLIEQGVQRVGIWGRGVDSVRFHPSKRSQQWRDRVAPHGERIILYVGRLAPEKQVGDLQVLADLPNTRIAIVGSGPSQTELETFLPGAVFLGHQGGEDLATAYASADLFVTPGELETFGQTIQEAMASGLPVIAPARGGPLDLINPSRTGWLYSPGDLASLRRHARDLLGDERKRQAFGTRARQSVEHRTWDYMCGQLLDYYREAIETAPRLSAA